MHPRRRSVTDKQEELCENLDVLGLSAADLCRWI